MTKDDILKRLGLGDKLDKTAGGVEITSTDGARPAKPASDTAIECDAWTRRKGAELATEFDWPIKKALDEAERLATATDCRAAAYEPDPILAPVCSNLTRGAFIRELLDSPQWQSVRQSTLFDEDLSRIAAHSAAAQLAALAEQQQEERAGGKTPGADKAGDGEVKAMVAAAKAGKAAKAEIDQQLDAQESLGGLGGDPSGRMPSDQAAALFRRVRNSSTLRRICELAGRYRRVAQARQRCKSQHGLDDMVGVTLGGDIERLTGGELAMLACEDTEDYVLAKIIERKALVHEYRGVEPLAKGPIVVTVDESGSMNGEKIENAKALALALAWIAKQQNRWCAMVGYSGGCSTNTVVLPPGRWDQVQLLDWLEHFYGGGTDRDVPLVELPDEWAGIGAPRGKTDIVMVTDALAHIGDQIIERWNTWRAGETVSVDLLLVGGHGSGAGDLAKCVDRVHSVPQIDASETAVGEILSV